MLALLIVHRVIVGLDGLQCISETEAQKRCATFYFTTDSANVHYHVEHNRFARRSRMMLLSVSTTYFQKRVGLLLPMTRWFNRLTPFALSRSRITALSMTTMATGTPRMMIHPQIMPPNRKIVPASGSFDGDEMTHIVKFGDKTAIIPGA